MDYSNRGIIRFWRVLETFVGNFLRDFGEYYGLFGSFWKAYEKVRKQKLFHVMETPKVLCNFGEILEWVF